MVFKSVAPHPVHFFQGASLFVNGVRHAVKTPPVFALCMIPFLGTLLFLHFFFSQGQQFVFGHLEGWLLPDHPYTFFLGAWIYGALKWVLKGVAVLIFVLCSYVILQILNVPFCSFVAERVLKGKGIVTHENFKDSLSFNLRMIRVGLIKALIVALIGFTFFITSFFPLLSLLPLYFAYLVLSYDSFDYGLELYGLSFKERSSFFSQGFFFLNGHGAFLFLMSLIPGVILLTMPFSVVGASLKLGELYEFERKNSSTHS